MTNSDSPLRAQSAISHLSFVIEDFL